MTHSFPTRRSSDLKPMPMQSVFKLPLAIAVMDAADKGKLSLDDTVSLAREQLSVAHSTFAEAFPERTDYTIEALIRAAVAQSDNTYPDPALNRLDGPHAHAPCSRRPDTERVPIQPPHQPTTPTTVPTLQS